MPISNGTIVFPLQSTLLPYKDYYYPVGPLSYFAAQLTASKNFGLHNFNMLALCLVPLFGIACYSLARYFLKPFRCLLLSVLSITLVTGLRFEQVSGWNIQLLFLVSISFTCFVHSVIANSRGRRNWKLLALLSGFFFSLSAIEDQIVVLVVVIFSLLLIFWPLLNTRDQRARIPMQSLAYGALGGLPVFIFTAVFLLKDNLLKFFIADMLGGGGKNPQFSNFPYLVYESFKQYISVNLLFLISAVAVAILIIQLSKRNRPELRLPHLPTYLENYLLLLSISFFFWRLSYVGVGSLQIRFLLGEALVLNLALLLNVFEINTRVKKGLATFLFLALPISIAWDLKGSFYSINKFLSSVGATTSALMTITLLLFLVATFGCLLFLSRLEGSKFIHELLENVPVTFSELTLILVCANALSIGSFVYLYDSGIGFYEIFFLPQLVIYFSVLVLMFGRLLRNRPIQNPIPIWVALIVISLVAQTTFNPYQWNQWTEGNIFAPHSSSHLPGLYGFQLSENDLYTYNRIRTDSSIAAIASGAAKNATVYSYPNEPTASIASGLKIYAGIKCSELWFDTCPNNQAALDLISFEKSPPNVIIWMPIDAGNMAFNESIFTHGTSALEGWESFRLLEVARGRWKLIDSFSTPATNGSQIYVYAVLKK